MLKKKYLKNKPVCKVTFVLSKEASEGASDVRLLGDFNDWNLKEAIPMKAGKNGFSTEIELEAGRAYEFRYIADGDRWLNDWKADDYVPSPFFGIDNSVVRLDPVVVKAPAKKAAPKKAVSRKAPAKKKAAKEDLKKIEGIGPKIEGLLNAKGITTFDDLAKAKKSLVQEILDAAGPRFRMHDPATWAKQAKLAAKGDWDALKKLQDELKGGKVK